MILARRKAGRQRQWMPIFDPIARHPLKHGKRIILRRAVVLGHDLLLRIDQMNKDRPVTVLATKRMPDQRQFRRIARPRRPTQLPATQLGSRIVRQAKAPVHRRAQSL